MSLQIFATFGKFFKMIFSSFGIVFKTIFSKVGIVGVLGWRMFLFITIALIFIGNSIATAVEEQDAFIVIEDFGSFLLSTDTAIEKETQRVLDEKDTFRIGDYFFSFLNILSNFYMIYFMYWLFFKFFDFFSNQSMPIMIKFMWSSLFILVLRMSYITIMVSTGRMGFSEDFDNNVFRLLLPYHGIWLFAQNMQLWTQPIVDFLSK